MTEQRFALTWTDYRSSLVSAFESLRADEELVDVTLGCQGRRFGAHKVLLSACSPYFRALLRGMHPGQHPVIMLHGSEANAPDLEAILEFVYSGEVSVEESRLNSFLMSARALQIIGLTEGCGARTAPLASAPPTAAAITTAAVPPGSVVVATGGPGGVARVEMPGRKRKGDIGKGKGKKAKKIKQQQQEAATPAAAAAVPQAQFLVEGSYGDEEVNFTPAVPQHLIDGSGGESSQHCYTESGGVAQPSSPSATREGMACKVCGKVFQTKNALLDHTKVHWGKTQCGMCGKVFSTQGNMKRHKAKVHNMEDE